jgi:hypothetical protein
LSQTGKVCNNAAPHDSALAWLKLLSHATRLVNSGSQFRLVAILPVRYRCPNLLHIDLPILLLLNKQIAIANVQRE